MPESAPLLDDKAVFHSNDQFVCLCWRGYKGGQGFIHLFIFLLDSTTFPCILKENWYLEHFFFFRGKKFLDECLNFLGKETSCNEMLVFPSIFVHLHRCTI